MRGGAAAGADHRLGGEHARQVLRPVAAAAVRSADRTRRSAEGWDAVRVDGVRRRLVARCRDELARAARLTLVGSSGERVVVPATAASEAWARDGLTRPAGTLARAGSDGVVYSELGILRLMLADPQSTDLSRFVRETVGPVLDYDREHGSALLETLRAYVESGCSQQLAAARWFVHVKTVKYRLVQVEKLTGLDLAAHHDRLRVDIAVRAAELFRTGLT